MTRYTARRFPIFRSRAIRDPSRRLGATLPGCPGITILLTSQTDSFSPRCPVSRPSRQGGISSPVEHIAVDPGGAPAAYLEDILSLGTEFPGRVLVCAFRVTAIYLQAQAGSTYSVWRSLYEPFGGVTEFYLQGRRHFNYLGIAILGRAGDFRDRELQDRKTSIPFLNSGFASDWIAVRAYKHFVTLRPPYRLKPIGTGHG